MDDATALMEQPGTETEPSRTNKRWELAEDALLICRAADGMELAAIALRLDRPEDGVRRRLKRMCDGKVTVPAGYEEHFKRAKALHGHGPQRLGGAGWGRFREQLAAQQQQITALHQAVDRIGRMVLYALARDAAGDDEARTEMRHMFGADLAERLISRSERIQQYRSRRAGIARQIAQAEAQSHKEAPPVLTGQGDFQRGYTPETPAGNAVDVEG